MVAINPRKRYRLGVGMVIMNRDNKIFVGQRYDSSQEAWQMPQGGIDRGEDPDQAVFRELKEEVGTDKVEVIDKMPRWLYYDLPYHLRTMLWKGRYYGQKQLWYLMRFIGDDSEINIKTPKPEFRQWLWVEPEKIIQHIVPFKKELYEEVFKYFQPYFDEHK